MIVNYLLYLGVGGDKNFRRKQERKQTEQEKKKEKKLTDYRRSLTDKNKINNKR